jgi:pyruvate dehydrogenase E2 component (dihydrolipoamide acetyltransferase)
MYGISHFIAVINPPQAAILAVGAGRQEIRLKSSLTSSKIDLDSLSPSPSSASASTPSSPSPSPSSPAKVTVNVVDVTLSCDNRVIDEALAGQFLERFQKYLSTPEMLVL